MRYLFLRNFTYLISSILILSSLFVHGQYASLDDAVKKAAAEKTRLTESDKKISSALQRTVRLSQIDGIKSGEKFVEKYNGRVVQVDKYGRVYIQVYLHKGAKVARLKDYIESIGGEVINSSFPERHIDWFPEIYAWTPIEIILELANDAQVKAIKSVAKASYQVGDFTTPGDEQLRASHARNQFGVTGNQVKVGTISNGVDNWILSTPSDLPNITDLDINGTYYASGDEGTAMLEIIHDLAPQASLYFVGLGEFPNPGLLETAISILFNSQSCKVVVDDLYFLDVPAFEDNGLNQSISYSVNVDDKTYVSAAGNNGLGLWAGDFLGDANGWHIWDENPTAEIENKIIIEQGNSVDLTLHWADPWTSATNDYDLFLVYLDGSVVATGQGVSNIPMEQIQYTNTDKPLNTFYVKVKLIGGSSVPIKFVANQKNIQFTYNSSIQGGPTNQIYGHHAADGAISVAAYPGDNENVLEDFSSRGPTNIRFPQIETRFSPTISATDKIETKIGSLIDPNTGQPFFSFPFFGTSAAAPHIAGIAALYYEKFGISTPQINFYNALTSTAVPFGGYIQSEMGYGKADAQAALGGVSVLIDQLDKNGNSASDIDIWENNSWQSHTAPHTVIWDIGSNQVIRADQQVVNDQKYKWWNQSSEDLLNHKYLNAVSQSTSDQRAFLADTYGATLTTFLQTLNQAGSLNGSLQIGFKDPWFPDEVDGSFGTRNRGSAAVFQNNATPFDLSVQSTYKGVFWNLDPLTEPSYEIRVNKEIVDVNNVKWLFEDWNTSNATITNPAATSGNYYQSPVIFTGPNSSVTANYKAHFASSTKKATSSSNGYKLTTNLANDDLHLVYIDNGRLYYTMSTDGGTNWSKDERLDASSNYSCLNPSIGVDKNGKVHIVWEREGTSTYDVEYITKTGSTWSTIEDLGVGIFGGEEPTTPTVHVEYNGNVFVAWKRSNTFWNKHYIEFRFKTVSSSTWTISDDVPGTDANSKTPTIIYGSFGSAPNNTYVFWRDDSEEVIKYISGDYTFSNWIWDANPQILSSSTVLSEHDLPSVQSKRGSSDKLYLTWQATEQNSGETKQGTSPVMSSGCPPASIDFPAVCFQEFDGSWSGLTIFRTSSPCDRKPVVTSWATTSGRKALLAFEKSPGNITTVLRDEFGSWGTQTTVSSNGSNPALTSVLDADPNLVYTVASGLPHPLVFDDDLLPSPSKEDIELPHSRLMSLNIAKSLDGGRNSGLNGSLGIEIGDLQLSTVEGVEYIEPQFRGSEFNQSTAFTFKAIPASGQLGTLKIPVTIKGLNLSRSGQRSSRPIIKMNILDAATNTVLQTVKTYQTDIIGNQNRFEQKDTIEVDLSSIVAPLIYIDGKTFLQKNTKDIVIADVYDLRETESLVATQDGKPADDLKPEAVKGNSEALPTDYSLFQNYPNPFNPTTQIEFALPKTSHVELKIFDTNGRLVKTLVANTMEAGQHRHLWDSTGENGVKVVSGVYFYRLRADTFVDTNKMMLIQ